MSLFKGLITRSQAMETVLRSAQLIAQTDASVLITGESGTGKELVARGIHQHSRRAGQALVAINCATLPETLAESLLFGHLKGAFSGADRTQEGLIASASGGTVFLDEIGELPLVLQAKLLRFLESGEITALGATRTRKVDARIVAATHRDLQAMVEDGLFREDLYYRLMVVPVELPALRQRREDIPTLAGFFMQNFAREHGLPAAEFSRAVLQHLQKQPWTGNVRELKNLCERLSILMAGQRIEISNLPLLPQRKQGKKFELPEGGLCLEEMERDLMFQALDRVGQNRSKAARLLGISRDAINYRLKKYAAA